MAALGSERQKPLRAGQFPNRLGVAVVAIAGLFLLASGCGTKATIVNARMGDAVLLGGVEHTVLAAEWKPGLGQGAEARVPVRQFLVLRLAVNNKSSDGAELASMRLVAADGSEHEELADGSAVPEWLGLVRRLNPGESRQGSVLFDAPKAVYQLKLIEHTMDGDEANVALVEIPIRSEETAIPTGVDPTATITP